MTEGMRRWLPGGAVLLVVLVGAAAEAEAQSPQMGASTPLPLVTDLKKVPVGSWSEYRIALDEGGVVIRLAVVGRSARGADVESEIKGGPIAALGRTVVRMSLPLDAADEIRPREQAIQIGDNPPMLLPGGFGGERTQTFRRLDPRKRVGVEDIRVPAGSFRRAEHYRDKGPQGEPLDFWVSKDVLPFGLLKVSSPAASPGGPSVSMELTGHGGGQKPLITQAPQPFDPATIAKQTEPAAAGGDGSPPPRPIPSPHPGMPPTPLGPTPNSAGGKHAKPGKSAKPAKPAAAAGAGAAP